VVFNRRRSAPLGRLITGAADAFDQRGKSGRRIRLDMRCLGGEVHRDLVHARNPAQYLFHTGDTAGAGHPGNGEIKIFYQRCGGGLIHAPLCKFPIMGRSMLDLGAPNALIMGIRRK
jgi:hypothetical protein